MPRPLSLMRRRIADPAHSAAEKPSHTEMPQMAPAIQPPLLGGGIPQRATNIRACALAYAEFGWKILPLKNGAKTPITSRGVHDATDDPDIICSWLENGKRQNIGIRTGQASGIIVIDIDVKDGAGGLESLAALEQKYGKIVTRRVLTPSGGLHLYFRVPKVMIRNKVRTLPGIDVRGEGGYIVAPPSVIDMVPYQWEDEDIEIADMPDWLIDILTDGERKGGQLSSGRALLTMAEALGGVSRGLRNDTIFRLACLMRQEGFDYYQTIQVVLAVAASCRPALPEDEAIRCVNNAFSYAPPTYLSDLGNAERFVDRNSGNIRFLQENSTWMVWNGFFWETGAITAIHRLVKEMIRSIADEAAEVPDEDMKKAILAHARGSESRSRIDAMLSLASRESGVAIKGDDLDSDDLLLGVKNGVVDLRTGQFRPAKAEDLITKTSLTIHDPNATCPHWTQFLSTIFDGDADMVTYIQRVAGYLLTGLTTERVFFVFHGDGANGKSTLIEVVRALLGDYALQALPETFMSCKLQRGANNDIARMAGARFVSAVESEEGQRLAEGLVKSLTGGDTITARFLFKEYTEFRSRFKLVLVTNHRPEIRGTAPAIWDRLHLVPFPISIPASKRDQNLRQTLLTELPGILNWAIAGCLQWQHGGLMPPETVCNATRDYREREDLMDLWLDERTVRSPEGRTQASQLYTSFVTWLKDQGEETITQRQFGERLQAKGYRRGKSNTFYYQGIEFRRSAEQGAEYSR